MKKLAICLMVVLMVSTVASANGLLGYWNFEGTTNDVSGYGFAADAALTGTATLATEAGRNCLKAVGGGALIGYNDKWDDIVGFPAYQIENNTPRGSGITLSIWIKPLNVDEQWKFLFGSTTGWGARMFSMNSGSIADIQTAASGWNPVQVWQGNDWSGNVPNGPSLAWHNVIFTYDYTVQEDRMYIDGVLKAQSSKGPAYSGWWAASTDMFGIGTDNGTNFVNQYMDDAAVFSGAADAADAMFLAQGGSVYDVDIQSIPEPATMSLLGLGLLGLIRRK